MSRWLHGLNQVSNLLEKLDDRVENVVEERAIASDDGDVMDSHGPLIDDILTRRGLNAESKDDVIEDPTEAQSSDGALEPTQPSIMITDSAGDLEQSSSNIQEDQTSENQDQNTLETNDEADTKNKEENLPPDLAQKPPSIVASKGNTQKSQKEIELVAASKEAQKEVRVLRRHVVKLNGTLERAENEITALRAELGRAGERMEKDRTRAKEEKENAQKRFTEELNALRAQHDQALKDRHLRFEEQLANYKSKLNDLENRRKQEGGDWNKEIAQAFEREQEMSNRVTLLEDEKGVLLNQIATLQSQQVALGSRVESLALASENAMAREREAEDRLDATLSQHARQISQRQAREAELERIIQELNSALVSRAGKNGGSTSHFQENKGSPDVSLRARIEVLESDLSTTHSQLALERERSEVLHQQLKEMSKESTQEASSVQVKELQYQRRVAEMTLTISRLEAGLREAQKESSNREKSSTDDLNDEELAQQVRLLSEEVLRLRDKLGNTSGELLALKNRLQTALERASKAEEELAMAAAGASHDMYDSMEQGGGRGRSGLARRRRPDPQQTITMRAAMRLDPGQGDHTEQIGKVVDAVDSFAVTAGKYLRRNPMARAGFILYLLVVHMWTFVLLFFHAHNFDAGPSELGPVISVGPQALLEQHKQIAMKEAEDAIRGG